MTNSLEKNKNTKHYKVLTLTNPKQNDMLENNQLNKFFNKILFLNFFLIIDLKING